MSEANFSSSAASVQCVGNNPAIMGIDDGLYENMSTAQDTYDHEKEIMKEFLSEPFVDQKRPIEDTLPELTKDPIFFKKIHVGDCARTQQRLFFSV